MSAWLGWMAWTWPTALFFAGIFAAIGLLVLVELRFPGGGSRRGMLGFTTTRGDRLFLSLLGGAYIFLFWLALFGVPLWRPLFIALLWVVFCFWKA